MRYASKAKNYRRPSSEKGPTIHQACLLKNLQNNTNHPKKQYAHCSAINERFVRCLWYDGQLFLKKKIRSLNGRELRVVSPGCWNMGRGPDFLGGVFQLDENSNICGDVEIHRRRGDWKAHAHQRDPGFKGVMFHVFLWNDGTNGPCRGYSGNQLIEICLANQIRKNVTGLLSKIDTAHYPYIAYGPRGACGQSIARWTEEDLKRLLLSAGEARLAEKTLGIWRLIERVGEEQAFYTALLEALGYASYKTHLNTLSNKLPWKMLCKIADSVNGSRRGRVIEAVLMGVAGLIPDSADRCWDTETKRYWKSISLLWVRLRSQWKLSSMQQSSWRRWGSRPANNPSRRLAAISHLLSRSARNGLMSTIFAAGTCKSPESLEKHLGLLLHSGKNSYWTRRYVWGGKCFSKPVALLGRERTLRIITNVLLPFLYYGGERAKAIELFREIPAASENSVTKLMISRLFSGMRHLPRSWGIAAQQGLIHIYKTFCDNDKSGCHQCPLPELLRRTNN